MLSVTRTDCRGPCRRNSLELCQQDISTLQLALKFVHFHQAGVSPPVGPGILRLHRFAQTCDSAGIHERLSCGRKTFPQIGDYLINFRPPQMIPAGRENRWQRLSDGLVQSRQLTLISDDRRLLGEKLIPEKAEFF